MDHISYQDNDVIIILNQNDCSNDIHFAFTGAEKLATIQNIIFAPTPCTIYALAEIRSAIVTLPPSAAVSLRLTKK